MDIAFKDGVYFGSILVAFVWNYANTNKKIDLNKRELSNLKDTLNLIIEKEKTLFQKEFDSINSKLDTYFTKIDDLRNRMEDIEKDSVTFIHKEDVLKEHPTKNEFDNRLSQLEKTDNMLQNEVLGLKKELNKKFDKLEKSLEIHIKEEREAYNKQQDTLNKILFAIKDKQ